MQILKEKIKEDIIESARASFINEGYEKATLKDIADKADISVGNIYRYFKSKEEIMIEIMRRFKENISCYDFEKKNILLDASKKEYIEFIRVFSAIIVDNYEYFRMTARNRDNKHVLDFKDFMIGLSIKTIKKAIPETRVDDVIARAWVVATFEGLAELIVDAPKADKKQAERITVYLELVLKDIRKRIEVA